MSNMKRQSSWQEDIARNFSRLFLRSKSQEPQKTGNDGSNVSSDGDSRSPCTDVREEDAPQELVLELSKAFHGSKGERGEGAEVGEEAEVERENQEEEQEGEGEGSSVLDVAGGSPSQLPSRSPPRSPPAAPGPGTPTAPLDTFFRKLSSLFHLSSKAEPGNTETQHTAVAEAAEETVVEPDVPGMTRALAESGETSDPSGRPAGEVDTSRLLQEGREMDGERVEGGRGGGREGESGEPPCTPADQEPRFIGRPAQNPEEHRQTDPQGLQHLDPNEVASVDLDVTCGGVTADDQTPEESADEQQRLLALSCPPTVTYGTYRGLREIKKMRRRNRVQVDSPILEGEETQQSCSSEAKLSPPRKYVLGAAASECIDGEGSCSPTGDSDTVTPTRLALGGIPVMMLSENNVSQSALPLEPEPDLAHMRGQTTDPCPGAVSLGFSLPAAEKASSDRQTVHTEAGNKSPQVPAESSSEKTVQPMDVIVAEDTKAGTKQAEIQSVQEGLMGSPSKGSDVLLGRAGGAQGTALTHHAAAHSDAAVLSRNHGGQLDPCCISPTGAQEPEDKQGPVPADGGTDVQESVPAAGKSKEEFLAAETESIEDTRPGEKALWSISRWMVDNIIKNALTALEKTESREWENRDEISPILPAEQADISREAEHIHERNMSELADASCLSVLVEQTPYPSRDWMEGNRSTQSSGYMSIGSDTDIRNSECNVHLSSVGSSVTLSDHRQGKHYPMEESKVLNAPELYTSCSGEHNGCLREERDPQLNSNINSVLLYMGKGDPEVNDNQDDGCNLNEKSKSVSSHRGSLEADSGEVTERSKDVLEESVAGKVSKDNLDSEQVSNDNTFALSTEAISKALQLAKDKTESNLSFSTKEIVVFQQPENIHGVLEMFKVDLEKPSKFNGVKDESRLSIQHLENTKTFQREAQSRNSIQSSSVVEPELKNTEERHILSAISGPPQSLEESLKHLPTKEETTMDCMSKNIVLQDGSEAGLNSYDDICHTNLYRTQVLQELNDDEKRVGDQSFALVESYLVTIVEDESESGGEENGALCARPRFPDAYSRQETLKDPESQESPLRWPVNSTLGPEDEDTQQQMGVKAYQCHDFTVEGKGSDMRGHAAGARFREDVSSRASSLVLMGRKMDPDLLLNTSRGEPSSPHIHRFHEMDFHECEGGFAIINEEEEPDAVFVNDTGTMLSPTTRRSKVYPFSLSPIFEEESGREEAYVDNLQEPPVTEEDLRSVEQQASSILSLLQSVSERLQSSAFTDSYPDSSEDLSPTMPQPPWGCLSDQAEEDSHVSDNDQNTLLHLQSDKQKRSPDRTFINNETGSFSLVDRLTGGIQEAPPPEEADPKPLLWSESRTVSKSPFYEYLKSARYRLPQSDTDNTRPHSKIKLCHGLASTLAPMLMKEEGKSSENVSTRPTQMHIFDGPMFSEEKREVHADVEDATRMLFPHGASVRVLRGCWLLYRDPGFRGPCVVLEEGEKVLSQAGGLFCPESNSTAVNIGSIRRVVKDHSTPEILIHTRDAQGLAPERFSAAVDNLGKHGPIHPSSLTVSCGCWVAYDGTGFSGNYAVLEAGGSVTPGPNNQSISCVKSLRPLRMGGLKVLRPMDPKMVVYEQPCFKGQSRELGDNTLNLAVQQGLLGAASVRVLGGVWVGYSSEGYKGHQYLLEEGEYRDCLELGGSDQALLSFRFLQADFLEPSISLLSGQDLPEAKETDVTDLDIQDLEQAGSAEKTVSILVRSGVWVAYSERSFCGKQYVLEKGTYTGDLDWGSSSGAPVSIRPIRMEPFLSGEPTFLLRAYSQPYYQGDSKEYNAEVQDRIPIVPLSFRVIRGSWLLFDEEGCAGNQFVLGEGLYPDLISCGCVAASIKSLKPIPYRFSDPSISLFSLDSFEGQETVVVTSRESMNNFLTQSLQVNSGLWVVYEYGHFKGRRMLLHPGRIFAWGDHSGWDTIGSLHPLKPPKSYMRVRSRAVGSVLTADILMDEAPPAKVCLRPAQGLDTQHWVFTGGLLKCKVSKACLSVIGGKALPGARVALWPEHGRTHQKWSLNENGTISSHLNHNLVLDFRGGKGFEKDHLVVSEFMADQASQYWDVEVA